MKERSEREKKAILAFSRELERIGEVPKGTVERTYFNLYMKNDQIQRNAE